MRIDDLNRTPVTPGTEKSGQTGQRRPPEKDGVAISDQAEVSHLAQSLSAPEPGRIEELRLQVQSGSYEVSAQSVANALIDAHLNE
ncbi:MAG: flagellar biosynthesis anti-sigma factor FlgM [Bryobacteraceae bacterium]|jgi:anti-sigma28 factor (negative regulator of flagellin synthesis)